MNSDRGSLTATLRISSDISNYIPISCDGLKIEPGELILLLGPPGSGKTTLMLALAGILQRIRPELKVRGHAQLDNIETVKLLDQGTISFTSDYPYTQLSGFKPTVWGEVAYGLELRGITAEESSDSIAEALRVFGIYMLRDRNPLTLSGGQLQRVILAASAVTKPRLWLLDRPLSELDTQGQKDCVEYLKGYARKNNAIVIITDDLTRSFASESDRLIVPDEESCFRSMPNTPAILDRFIEKGYLSNDPQAEFFKTVEYKGSSPTIKFDNVTFSYRDNSSHPVFSNLSWAAGPGGLNLVVGPNGSGKSTMLRLLLGFETPNEGQILLLGKQPSENTVDETSFSIGIVFQDPDRVLFLSSVRKELEYGPRVRGIDQNEISRRMKSISEELRIESLLDLHPKLLPLSSRKRVAIASIFMNDTKVIAIDEPFRLLNINDRIILLRALLKRVEVGYTVILTSHDLSFIGSIVNHISSFLTFS